MSSMQKALKILSLLAIVGGIDLAITAAVLTISGEPVPDFLFLSIMALTVLFALLLGGLGIGAAHVPIRAVKLLPIIVVALLVNAADVVLSMQTGLATVSIVINALIVLAYAAAAHRVNKQALDRLG